MKAQLFVRLFHLTQKKLDICLEYMEKIAELFVRYSDVLPDGIKDKYLEITEPTLRKYTELIGREEELDDQEEKEE